LENLYQIPALMRPIEGNRFVNPAKDLCVHVARNFARLGKLGSPNMRAAAQIIMEDCLKGKIEWYIVDE
jgi:ribosome biogenesis GTPase A